MKVLVIDDDDDLLAILEMALTALGGMEVVLASDGREGLALAVSEAPDVILLDVMMPEISGRETLAELRKDDRTKDICVFFLTTAGDVTDRVELQATSGNEVLLKPFEPTDLVERLQEANGNRSNA